MSPMGALLRTYWQLGLRLLVLPSVLIFMLELLGRTYAMEVLPYVIGFLCCTNPLAPLMMAVVPEMYAEISAQAARFGWLIGNWFFPLLLVIPLLRAWILTRRATRRLRFAPAVGRSKIFGILAIRKFRLAFVNGLAAPFRGLGSPERLLRIVPVRNPLWLRARQCHCFDREGHLGRLQGWAWVVAAVFLLLIGLSEFIHGRRVLRDPDIVIGFLPITYIALAIFCTIVASTSVVGDRRRGFFDLLLTTPLTGREVVDGNFLSVWAHVNTLLCLPFALALLFRFTGAGKFVDLATSLAMASLYMAVVAFVGIACSLCARSLAGALVPTFIFVLVPNIGIAFLMPVFMRYAPIVLWFLNLTGLVVASYWVRRKMTPAAVGCYLLFVYQCLVTGAASWIAWKDTPNGEPLVTASMPSFLAFTVLSVRRPPVDLLPFANWLRTCHLLATLVFCLWARWWLIAHFESLVGRASGRARRPGSLAHSISATVQFFYWHIPEALRPRWRGKPKASSQAVEPALSDGR
jgi:ABC-type transport system involved in multi-copper enzyme maturation permease subunit